MIRLQWNPANSNPPVIWTRSDFPNRFFSVIYHQLTQPQPSGPIFCFPLELQLAGFCCTLTLREFTPPKEILFVWECSRTSFILCNIMVLIKPVVRAWEASILVKNKCSHLMTICFIQNEVKNTHNFQRTSLMRIYKYIHRIWTKKKFKHLNCLFSWRNVGYCWYVLCYKIINSECTGLAIPVNMMEFFATRLKYLRYG